VCQNKQIPTPALISAKVFSLPANSCGKRLFCSPRAVLDWGAQESLAASCQEAQSQGEREPASVVSRTGRACRQELVRILEGENYIRNPSWSIPAFTSAPCLGRCSKCWWRSEPSVPLLQ